MKKTLMFDFDGVINDSLEVSLNIFEKISKKYKLGIEPTRENYVKLNNMKFREMLNEFQIPLIKGLIVGISIKKEIRRSQNEFKIFPGMKQLLEKLSKNNNMSIITTHIGKMEPLLEKFQISQYFEFVRKTGSREEKLDKMKECLEHFGSNPKDAFFITDNLKDVKQAKKLNVKSIAVTWGINTEERLLEVKPDFIARKQEDIIKIIKS